MGDEHIRKEFSSEECNDKDFNEEEYRRQECSGEKWNAEYNSSEEYCGEKSNGCDEPDGEERYRARFSDEEYIEWLSKYEQLLSTKLYAHIDHYFGITNLNIFINNAVMKVIKQINPTLEYLLDKYHKNRNCTSICNLNCDAFYVEDGKYHHKNYDCLFYQKNSGIGICIGNIQHVTYRPVAVHWIDNHKDKCTNVSNEFRLHNGISMMTNNRAKRVRDILDELIPIMVTIFQYQKNNLMGSLIVGQSYHTHPSDGVGEVIALSYPYILEMKDDKLKYVTPQEVLDFINEQKTNKVSVWVDIHRCKFTSTGWSILTLLYYALYKRYPINVREQDYSTSVWLYLEKLISDNNDYIIPKDRNGRMRVKKKVKACQIFSKFIRVLQVGLQKCKRNWDLFEYINVKCQLEFLLILLDRRVPKESPSNLVEYLFGFPQNTATKELWHEDNGRYYCKTSRNGNCIEWKMNIIDIAQRTVSIYVTLKDDKYGRDGEYLIDVLEGKIYSYSRNDILIEEKSIKVDRASCYFTGCVASNGVLQIYHPTIEYTKKTSFERHWDECILNCDYATGACRLPLYQVKSQK